jgi:hypothetical protein
MLPHIPVHTGGTMKTFPNPPSSTKTRNSSIEPTAELQERIRERAYELYEQHGREDGHDCDDWLQAESEITGKRMKTVAA